jgi:hypothetical protein
VGSPAKPMPGARGENVVVISDVIGLFAFCPIGDSLDARANAV